MNRERGLAKFFGRLAGGVLVDVAHDDDRCRLAEQSRRLQAGGLSTLVLGTQLKRLHPFAKEFPTGGRGVFDVELHDLLALDSGSGPLLFPKRDPVGDFPRIALESLPEPFATDQHHRPPRFRVQMPDGLLYEMLEESIRIIDEIRYDDQQAHLIPAIAKFRRRPLPARPVARIAKIDNPAIARHRERLGPTFARFLHVIREYDRVGADEDLLRRAWGVSPMMFHCDEYVLLLTKIMGLTPHARRFFVFGGFLFFQASIQTVAFRCFR